MAAIKHNIVDITRSEVCVTRVIVPAWEVPLLQAMHGPVKVNVVGSIDYEGVVPDAENEFGRLTNRYGRDRREDGSLGMPYAEAVFGQFAPGVMNLQRLIDAAITSRAA